MTTCASISNRAVVWFRRDLRLSDNPAWSAATAAADEVVPLFVLDDRLLHKAGRLRLAQLFATLADLDAELRRRGGRLLVRHGSPECVVAEVQRELGAAAVYANADVSGFAVARDEAVAQAVTAPVSWSFGSLVQPPGSVLTTAGRVSKVFTPFWRRWKERPLPVETSPVPCAITDEPGDGLPVLELDPPLAAGEEAARRRLELFVRARLACYPDDRDLLGRQGTSGLSADLKLGTLSPAEVARAVGRSEPGLAVLRQLAWRDWYAHLLHGAPELAWRPQRSDLERIRWSDDPDALAAWKAGRTGFPVVDAGMRELVATGSLPNRARMVAASFLVKDLLIDWRAGAGHFREHLIDYDPAQNSGNWQWVAGTGHDAAPYFRVMNPVTQGRRFDPDGHYVRRWVPELAGLEAPGIHAPWELAPEELAAAGVTLGADYPHPIVEHSAARYRALHVYGEARTR